MNNDIKILDPCAGNGNFGAYISTKTDLNNIWFNEINDKRLNNCKTILNPQNISKLNALDITPERFGLFDLVVANPPPYSGGGNKNKSISNEFIEKGIDLLKDGGYLCYITPNNWMSYNNNNTTLKKLLTLGTFVIIDNDAKKYFSKVGSSFTIFVWQKNRQNKTKIINNYLIKDIQKVNIPSNIPYIPLYISKETLSVISKTVGKPNGIDYRCDLHNFTQGKKLKDTQDEVFKYRTIHTIRNTRYANIKQDIYDKYIIVIPLSTYYLPFIEHNCNVTQSVAYMEFDNKESAEKTLKILKSDYIKVMIHIARFGNFNNIKLIKNINIDYKKFNKQELNKIIQLSNKIKY